MKAKRRRERGEGAIRRLADGTFEARVSLGVDSEGRRLRQRVYADSIDSLRLKIARSRKRKARYQLDAERITLTAFLGEWLEVEVRPNNRLATYRAREGTCRNHVVPYLGSMALSEIGQSHVRGLLQTLRAKGVGPRTQQLVRATLGRAFSVAVRDELLEMNPVAKVETPKARSREKIVLNAAQANSLLETAIGDRYEALYVLAISTGLRQGEIFALRWTDIDLEQATLKVQATLTEGENHELLRTDPKTESSRRIVDLPARCVRTLREHKQRTIGRTGWVFTDGSGRPIRKSNFIRRDFRPLLKRAGLPPITFHSLRHAANSILLADGADLRLLADRLGHSTTRTTLDHYSHVPRDRHRQAARGLDAIFGT